MLREITHTRRLVEVTAPLERFLTEVQRLSAKLGPLLIQLPPRLRFTEPLVQTFLTALRTRFHGSVVCEPRHQSRFSPAVEQLLYAFQVARVVADPARVPAVVTLVRSGPPTVSGGPWLPHTPADFSEAQGVPRSEHGGIE
jgi:uncharacterized protein YecE (DUF72 family)